MQVLKSENVSHGPESRVWVDIDLAKVRSNFVKIAAHVYPANVMAVLKANAYGLGILPIAETLKAAGVQSFGVAEIREALAIRSLGVPIHILGGLITDDIPLVVHHDIVAPITDFETAAGLSREAERQKKTVQCHYLIDTGMGRLGIPCDQAEKIIADTCRMPGLRCSGIYSHFPCAYDDLEFSGKQIQAVEVLLSNLRDRNIHFDYIHIANSDGINNIPESHAGPFNVVRTGINIYGVFDRKGRCSLALDPVLTLKTKLVATRMLPAGTTIGYGRSYTTKTERRIGTIAIGYADGFPLAMSNRGAVLVRGKKCSVLGRVSMDYTTVSLDFVPGAEIGDDVICLGGDISIGEWVKIKETHPYDIICSLGNRVERRYLTSGAA